jgi:hypothetical protein
LPFARGIGTVASLKDPADPTGRLRTTPGFAMVTAMTSGSFRRALVEEIAVDSQSFHCRFHRRNGDSKVEEPK